MWLKRHSEILIFLFFLMLTLVVTYPIIFRMSDSIYGYPGDSSGTIWGFWWQKYAVLHKIPANFVPIIASPFGVDRSYLPPVPAISLPALGLSLIRNEIFAYNFIMLLSFFVSAMTMYYLVYHLTKNKLAGMLSGTIFAFSPYHFMHSYGHLCLANIQWLPLYTLFLIRLDEEKSLVNLLLCTLAFLLVVFTDYYYALLMAVFTGAFVLYKLAHAYINRRNKPFDYQFLLAIGALLIISFLIIFPAIYGSLKAVQSAPQVLTHPLEELKIYSARPWEYLLPSLDNPILGKYAGYFIITHLHGSNPVEQTLYVGYVSIVLTMLALWWWIRKRNRLITEKADFAVPFFSFAAFVALIFSAPPYIPLLGLKIPLPPYFIFKIAPMFRVYARFGILVLMCLTVLAGYGFDYVSKSVLNKKWSFVAAILLLVVIGTEFTNIPPFRATDMSTIPPVYVWLSKQPGNFTIAEYPLVSSDNAGHYDYLFYQRIHQKRLVNGALKGTPADKVRVRLEDITNPRTPEKLRLLGVKYVIIHLDRYQPGEKPVIAISRLKLVKRFKNVQVYEVKNYGGRIGKIENSF